MRVRTLLLALPLTVLAGFAVASTLRQGQAPPTLQPSEQHKWLATLAGTWDAKMSMGDQVSKATWTARVGPGGLWVVGDYAGEFMGGPFAGHEVKGYDPGSDTFTAVWVDSMITKPMVMQGKYDAAAKKLTLRGEMGGPDGQMHPATSVTEYKGADQMLYTMNGPDGKTPMFTIEYTRRK